MHAANIIGNVVAACNLAMATNAKAAIGRRLEDARSHRAFATPRPCAKTAGVMICRGAGESLASYAHERPRPSPRRQPAYREIPGRLTIAARCKLPCHD